MKPLQGKRVNAPVSHSPVILQIAIIIILMAAWELTTAVGWASPFLFGSPSGIAKSFITLAKNGELGRNALYTLWASLIGFLVGTAVGSFLGLGLWYSVYVAKLVEPFLVAINSVPKIAFAPIIILWFGTGLISKIALSTSLTAVVALLAAYQAAKDTDTDLQKMMLTLGCDKQQIFTKVVVPSALPHIIATFRINIGFALLGTITGEFISATHGIGYMIFIASSMYDLNTVWVGVFTLMVMGYVLYLGINWVEDHLLRWKEKSHAPEINV